MISLTHRRPGRVLIVVLVVLLTMFMLLAMADASEARRLPRHRWRPFSDRGGGEPPATVTFECTWNDAVVEYRCDDNGGRIRLDAVMGAGGGNARPNQMAARPPRFTCTPVADEPDEVTDFTCEFPHRPQPVTFRLDEVVPVTDEEDAAGDPCAEVPSEDDDRQPTACASMLPPHDHGVRVARVVHSPVGRPDDSRNRRVNRERVVLHNHWVTAVRLGRARLMQVPATGAPVQRYQLPAGLTLAAGKNLVIHSGKRRNRAGHLYIGRSRQLWRRTDHILLTSRRGHHLTQCVYEGDAGAGINCNVPVP